MSDQTMSSDTIGIIAAILTVGAFRPATPAVSLKEQQRFARTSTTNFLPNRFTCCNLQRRSVRLVDRVGMS
jgi:hypothetical protein